MSEITWTLDGRNVTEHPDHHATGYRKTAAVLAAPAHMGGVVETPEGRMAFDVGDYLVTDNPPTHLWPVKRGVFEATYAPVPEAAPETPPADLSCVGLHGPECDCRPKYPGVTSHNSDCPSRSVVGAWLQGFRHAMDAHSHAAGVQVAPVGSPAGDALREALEWALHALRGATGYKHPPECSPVNCVCGWKRAADIADDAALATPTATPGDAPASTRLTRWDEHHQRHEA